MNSEMLGLSYLQIALGKTDHLVAHINSNDKEPSWDGDVEVYRKAGHVHAKADLILKVPVQVKGHCKPNLKKKSIKYSIQYADLKNYLAIGGTIFFVIYINDSGDKAAIYYVDLLPYDLKKHLKAYDGDPYKYKSIELKAFPKKKNDIADVFLNFTHHMNMQRASINSTPVTLESLCTSDPAQFSNIELTMGYSTTSRNYQFPFDYFLCCIKTLLHYGIHVDLGTNIDRHNHKEIWNTLDDLKKLQLLQDKNFAWTIGRVDDRLYETNFPDIMMESEILAELQSKPLPDNVHAAFLKTCYNFADKMGLKLNLREHKQTHSYCWSTSSSSNVFYVDMNLKTYRCTCTVGRSRYSLFDFSYENLTNYRPVAVTCNSYAECKDCKIGGFCGGGCQLSHQIDFKKCCTYEEEVFSHFMKTLFIPYIKSKYNEVNQNERKAENRCT